MLSQGTDMQAVFTGGNPAVKNSYFKVVLVNKGNGANVSYQTGNKLAARKLCILFFKLLCTS